MQIFDIPINSKRMETTRIGTFDFPLAVHENDLKKNVLGFVNWHWHYEFQLTYVVRGTISVFFNQQTIDLHEGQGIYINPEVLHMIRDRYDSDAMFISLDVSPKLLTSFPNSVFERSYVKPVFCSSAADAVILDPGVFWQKKILDEAMSIEQDYQKVAALAGNWLSAAAFTPSGKSWSAICMRVLRSMMLPLQMEHGCAATSASKRSSLTSGSTSLKRSLWTKSQSTSISAPMNAVDFSRKT